MNQHFEPNSAAEKFICSACAHLQTAVSKPTFCPKCSITDEDARFMTAETITIALQNDQFRKCGSLATFKGQLVTGRMVATSGIAALGLEFLNAALLAIGNASVFTIDSDPNGLRDFGIIDLKIDSDFSVRFYWKIDLYDTSYEHGSEHPSDPQQTSRVLTILLPSEY